MDFVSGFPLILLLLSSGHAYPKSTEQPSNKCYVKCPAGYHKVGDCNNPTAKYRCRKCDKDTFLAVENYLPKCLTCRLCDHLEVEIQACNFTSDRVCDCQEGYYNEDNNFSNCLSCTLRYAPKQNSDYEKKCQHNKRKDILEQSRLKLSKVPTPSTTSLPTSVTVTATKTLSNRADNPVRIPVYINSMSWLILWVVVVIFVVAFLLLLLITMLINQYRIPCWSTKKGVEEQVKSLKEHHIHQGSRPTTQMFHISEETPIMAHSRMPTHLLPSAESEARKQDEQSEHLPAIVLYAIIKEVPLRRWKEFLRLLSVADQQLERVELETGFGLSSMEKQYQMLRLWSQQSTASLSDVFSALHHMDLSGCAQRLQENLEKLA